jgi:hypothetical protein
MTPDATEALRDFGELATHLSRPENLDLLVDFGRLVDGGAVLLQIDRLAAVPTIDGIAAYKLHDKLGALLAAAKARQIDAGQEQCGFGHRLVSTGALLAETDG